MQGIGFPWNKCINESFILTKLNFGDKGRPCRVTCNIIINMLECYYFTVFNVFFLAEILEHYLQNLYFTKWSPEYTDRNKAF